MATSTLRTAGPGKVGTFDPIRPAAVGARWSRGYFNRACTNRSRIGGLLAVVADPVRWRLLAHLADGSTRCVCDLQPVAAVAANLLSYHLKVLREAGLVRVTRRGRWMDYTITATALDRLRAALPAAGADTVAPASATCPPESPSVPSRRTARLTMSGGSR